MLVCIYEYINVYINIHTYVYGAQHSPPTPHTRVQVLQAANRVQPKVPTVRCDSKFDKSGRVPAHRCEREGKGSGGKNYNPW